MAVAIDKITIDVECKTYFALVFFPVAKYERVGDTSLLSIFGIPVYERVGDAKSLFGFKV